MSALASLGNLTALAGVAGGLKNPADQYVALMQSRTVSDRIVDHFKLMQVYDVAWRDQARRELARNAQITLGKKDGLIYVDVDDTDPRRAADIANRYIDELKRVTAGMAITEAQQRRAFFEQQLQASRERLANAQRKLQDSGFNAGAIKAEPRAAADAYARVRAELSAAEVRLVTLRSTLAETSAEVQQLRATIGALSRQLAQLEGGEERNAANEPDYVTRYRDFKYEETLFELMARQFEIAKIDESREGATIQVVDPALPAERKSRPQRLAYGLMAALTAGGLWALVLLVLHQRRRAPGG